MTPVSRTVTRAGPAAITPYPVATSPGSIPRTRDVELCSGSRDGLEDLVRNVVVGVHGLDVVQLLQSLDQLHHGVRVLALDAHRRLWHERDLGVDHGDLLLFQRASHRVHF